VLGQLLKPYLPLELLKPVALKRLIRMHGS
jgi:hypothetical protein